MLEAGRVATQPSQPGRSVPAYQDAVWISWETVLLLAVFAIGSFARFFQLDLHPLSSAEADYAWRAWQLANGLAADDGVASPLFLTVQTLLFWLTGGSDFAARAMGALAGTLGLAALWMWRVQWGVARTLLTMLLFALAPWQVGLARTGDGGALALTLGLFALVLIQRLLLSELSTSTGGGAAREAQARIAVGLPVVLGLLLASGPLGWNFVVLVAIWLGLERDKAKPVLRALRQSWPIILVTLILSLTGWLARPHGIAALSTMLTAWLEQFTNSGVAGGSLLWLWSHLVGDYLLISLIGLVALFGVAWRVVMERSTFRDADWGSYRLLALWTLSGVVLALGAGRTLGTLAFLGMPLLIMATWSLTRAVSARPLAMDRGEALGVAITLAILLGALWIWTTDLVASLVLDTVVLQALLVIGAMLLILIALYIFWAGTQSARWLLGWALVLLCVLGGVRGTWYTSFMDNARTAGGFLAAPTHPQIRQLVADLETISAQRTGDPHRMWVQIEPGRLIPGALSGGDGDGGSFILREETDPILAWYLRKFASTTWPERLRARQANEPLVVVTPQAISGEGVASPGLGGSVAETTYPMRALWSLRIPAAVVTDSTTAADRLQIHWRTTVRPVARWFLYREPPVAPAQQRVRVRLQFAAEVVNP